MREYPAYGRTIAAHIVRGQKPICVAVLLSSRWSYFNHVPKVCIRPDEWAPGRYEFGYLRGLHLVVVPGDECSNEQLGELVVDLMTAGPRLLWSFDAAGRKLHDDEWPASLTMWAWELNRKLDWRVVRAGPEQAMWRSWKRAGDQWLAEYERIEKMSGLEAAIKFHLDTEAGRQRVRELFSAQWPRDDARAA